MERPRTATAATALRRFGGCAVMLAVVSLACATTPTAAERISPLVHDWFALLESRTADPSDFERFLASPAFELTGSDGQRLGMQCRARVRQTVDRGLGPDP